MRLLRRRRGSSAQLRRPNKSKQNQAIPNKTKQNGLVLFGFIRPKSGLFNGLGVWSRPLMEHSYRVIRRMRYGPCSTWERHDDRGGPSSDTA